LYEEKDNKAITNAIKLLIIMSINVLMFIKIYLKEKDGLVSVNILGLVL